VQSEPDWERYLPLALYAYQTAKAFINWCFSISINFGHHPKLPDNSIDAFDTNFYQTHLRAKLAELQDLVASNSASAAHRQQQGYNRLTKLQQFTPGDLVWLSVPTADKLTPHWEGRWKVDEVKNSINVKISNDSQSKVVHVNRLRHRIQPSSDEATTTDSDQPIDIEHSIVTETNSPARQYPVRIRNPPDRLRY